MFDVSFAELLVIALVALVVIGPEKLPQVARTLGTLVGRIQRYVTAVKLDIERETQFQDLQQLQNEIRENLNKTKASLQTEIAPLHEIDLGTALKPTSKPDQTFRPASGSLDTLPSANSEHFLYEVSELQQASQVNPAQAVESNLKKNN